ncbi:hypothetical protein I4F81_006742 [Pyropia yezoensis]|uniref:Uncharacterized protein n=1 Tax=Pyropia yezoensis TaxID=2788 RepID=A0ACC3C310_PYRYE|nr:hypothetical protein I4F81_006742 [Neopyropia yezoensis]
MMKFDGRVGVTSFEFSVDTVDVAGGAHTYRCGGSYVASKLSLVDDATGAVVSEDGGGAGVSLGSYADVLATGTVRLGVLSQACDAASSGGSRIVRRGAGAGGGVASLVWPAAAADGEAREANVAVRLDTMPPPPPVVTALLVDVDAVTLDVSGAELVGVSAFNAPVMCDGISAVQSADAANGGGRGLRVAFGDGRLAAAAVASGTAFVANSTAARAATLAVAVLLDVYTPTRISASKAADAPGQVVDESGCHGGRFVQAGSDASFTCSM